MKITLQLKYTRRFTGIDKNNRPYDFVSIPAETEDGKRTEVSLTPVEYAGIAGGIGVLDKIAFADAKVEPRKDGAVDRNGNVRTIATVDWTQAQVARAPFASKMPTLDELAKMANDRALAGATADNDANHQQDL